MKCVFIVDPTLPRGVLANTAAVLAMSVGNAVAGIVGAEVVDADGGRHAGITQLPLPLLQADPATLKELKQQIEAAQSTQTYVAGFSSTAQQARCYASYATEMSQTSAGDLTYLGLAIYGPAKLVSSLTGRLPLLR